MFSIILEIVNITESGPDARAPLLMRNDCRSQSQENMEACWI